MARPRGHVTEALVVRVVPYGETSQVVHLATPESGLLPALAKGARRPGPEFRGGLDLGDLGTAHLTSRRGSELEVLRRFVKDPELRHLGDDLPRYYSACYVLDLLRSWMRPALPNPFLYRAALTALRSLDAAAPRSLTAWVAWFEARAVAAGGHRPMLEACATCGRNDPAPDLFVAAAGGLVHPACAPPGESRRLTRTGRESLTRLYGTRLAELVAAPLSATALREIRQVHDLWIPYVLERRPSAMDGLPRP